MLRKKCRESSLESSSSQSVSSNTDKNSFRWTTNWSFDKIVHVDNNQTKTTTRKFACECRNNDIENLTWSYFSHCATHWKQMTIHLHTRLLRTHAQLKFVDQTGSDVMTMTVASGLDWKLQFTRLVGAEWEELNISSSSVSINEIKLMFFWTSLSRSPTASIYGRVFSEELQQKMFRGRFQLFQADFSPSSIVISVSYIRSESLTKIYSVESGFCCRNFSAI